MSFKVPPISIASVAILNEASRLGEAVGHESFLSPRTEEELDEFGHIFARACAREARNSPPLDIGSLAPDVVKSAMAGFRQGLARMKSRGGGPHVAHLPVNQYRVRPKMFDPKAYVKIILDAAYASGRDYAETMYGLTAVPPGAAALEKARDLHCEALTSSIARTAALDTLSLTQGVYASAFGGFEDRLRELSGMGIPDGDLEAIRQVGEAMSGSSRRPVGFDTGLFKEDEV